MTLVSVLGPTSSGKSDLAVALAHYLNEKTKPQSSVIVSVDSRQIYERLDLGTGKVPGQWQDQGEWGPNFNYRGVPHFLIDYVDPLRRYSLSDYLQDYLNLFKQWASLDRLPEYIILCGGTGMWAEAIRAEWVLPSFKEEFEPYLDSLKIELSQHNATKLQELYSSLLSQAKPNSQFKKLNQSDWQNPRRLVNQIIYLQAVQNGWLVETGSEIDYKHPKYDKKIAFCLQPENLEQRVHSRMRSRLEQGLLTEIELCLQRGYLSSARLLELGLEYRQYYYYHYGWITRQELINGLHKENINYVKRQITWLKKRQDLIQITSFQDLVDKKLF